MPGSSLAPLSGFKKIKHDIYSTMYRNVLARVCDDNTAAQSTDFLTDQHSDTEALREKYRNTPTAMTCPNKGRDGSVSEATYLVVGGTKELAVLMPPELALERNLPYISTLVDQTFKPYLGCPSTYWNEHIEPKKFDPAPATSLRMSAIN